MKNVTRGLAAALLTAALLFSFTPAHAQGSAAYTAKAPTTTAMQLVAGDSATTGVEITNNGSVTVYLGGSDVTSSTGYPLYVNNRVTFKGVSNPVYGITASGTGNLRIVTVRSGGSTETARLVTNGVANSAAANTIPMSNGTDIVTNNVLFNTVTSAITANSTANTDTAGTLGITSNSTGRGNLFASDGSKYQLMSLYADREVQATRQTITTTGNTDFYIICPQAATVESIDFMGVDALSASDTNYITFTVVNLGQSAGGSTALLAASDTNTTKSTGGSAITATARRSLTLHGTASNLVVAKGDVLRIRAAATGTLANTVSGNVLIRFTRLS